MGLFIIDFFLIVDLIRLPSRDSFLLAHLSYTFLSFFWMAGFCCHHSDVIESLPSALTRQERLGIERDKSQRKRHIKNERRKGKKKFPAPLTSLLDLWVRWSRKKRPSGGKDFTKDWIPVPNPEGEKKRRRPGIYRRDNETNLNEIKPDTKRRRRLAFLFPTTASTTSTPLVCFCIWFLG